MDPSAVSGELKDATICPLYGHARASTDMCVVHACRVGAIGFSESSELAHVRHIGGTTKLTV